MAGNEIKGPFLFMPVSRSSTYSLPPAGLNPVRTCVSCAKLLKRKYQFKVNLEFIVTVA